MLHTKLQRFVRGLRRRWFGCGNLHRHVLLAEQRTERYPDVEVSERAGCRITVELPRARLRRAGGDIHSRVRRGASLKSELASDDRVLTRRTDGERYRSWLAATHRERPGVFEYQTGPRTSVYLNGMRSELQRCRRLVRKTGRRNATARRYVVSVESNAHAGAVGLRLEVCCDDRKAIIQRSAWRRLLIA